MDRRLQRKTRGRKMVTPAHYEYDMKKLYEGINLMNWTISAENKQKAIDDTISVLKQFGYDSGAELFKRIANCSDK